MKKLLSLAALTLMLGSTNIYAHHPAADIVDEDIYAMIDSMVADTPHATLTFEDMGGGMTETSITMESLADLEDLIQQQSLLEYAEALDGVVGVSIQFNDDSSVTLAINQNL